MVRFTQRVIFVVATEVVGFVISEAIIQKIEKRKHPVIVDSVTYKVL